MNFLIICTFYPPDTAISAVRPYMFAKYLTKMGHSVTVLRSGLLNNAADSFFPDIPGVNVISFLGPDSPAERYKRGEKIEAYKPGESRIAFLPEKVRRPIARMYHSVNKPIQYHLQKRKTNEFFQLQKKAIDNLAEEQFDFVFSTYANLENAYAGEYAAKVFNCKWVMDFRDPITRKNLQPMWEYLCCKKIQESIIKKADLCTAVSYEAFLGRVKKTTSKKIATLHNGYEEIDLADLIESQPNKLVLCYTGQFYRFNTSSAVAALGRAVSKLIGEGKIQKDKICLLYAGTGAADIHDILQNYGVGDILEDYGYVTRSKVIQIQRSSDLFLVFSWNTKNEKGVLTGKFYDGIRAKKPILSLVAGNVPFSELFQLNKKYNYGFCYECSRETDSFQELCNYIYSAYREKINNGKVDYNPSPNLFSDFQYENITKRLEAMCMNLLEDEKRKKWSNVE